VLAAKFSSLPANEVEAALNAVVDCLGGIDLSDEALLEVDADPEVLARRVRAEVPVDSGLSELASRLYDVALDEACRYLIQVIRHLPAFQPRALAEVLGRASAQTAQLDDVLLTHRPEMSRDERRKRCVEVFRLVGVDPKRLGSYPHELSGGMRQRVMIAMALLLDPQVMIMDEPTTALDVVVQRGILLEILKFRDELGFAVVFITHDLPLLLEIADRIAVMRDGEVVEQGTAEDLHANPRHSYTRELLDSFPSLTGDRGGFVRGTPALHDGGVR
jgi:ABC-type dipeptide/oligopeptide/nickel transport system ATPase subunit